MSRIIRCSKEDLKKISLQLANTSKKAGTYCPKKEEIMEIIGKEPPYDLAYYIRFLLWVTMTGTETEENKADREYLSKAIAANLKIDDEERL